MTLNDLEKAGPDKPISPLHFMHSYETWWAIAVTSDVKKRILKTKTKTTGSKQGRLADLTCTQ